jgi:hypothetical protein
VASSSSPTYGGTLRVSPASVRRHPACGGTLRVSSHATTQRGTWTSQHLSAVASPLCCLVPTPSNSALITGTSASSAFVLGDWG